MGTKKPSTVRDASRGSATTTTTTRKTKTKMKTTTTGGGGGWMKTKPGDGDATDARANGDEETRRGSSTTTTTTTDAVEDDDFDVDALFGKAKKRMKSEKRAERRDGGGEEEARVRVLLPGQKKPKQRRTTPEFVPVEKARRFEDGLPVYKSYGDFTDMRHGQEGAGVDGKGRKLGPNGEPAGDCPFDCWCCF